MTKIRNQNRYTQLAIAAFCVLCVVGVSNCAKKEKPAPVVVTKKAIQKPKSEPKTELSVVVMNLSAMSTDFKLFIDGSQRKSGNLKGASTSEDANRGERFSLRLPRKQQAFKVMSEQSGAETKAIANLDAEKMWMLVTYDMNAVDESSQQSEEQSAATTAGRFDMLFQYEPLD